MIQEHNFCKLKKETIPRIIWYEIPTFFTALVQVFMCIFFSWEGTEQQTFFQYSERIDKCILNVLYKCG